MRRVWIELHGTRVGIKNFETLLRFLEFEMGGEAVGRQFTAEQWERIEKKFELLDEAIGRQREGFTRIFGVADLTQDENERGRLPSVERAIHDIRRDLTTKANKQESDNMLKAHEERIRNMELRIYMGLGGIGVLSLLITIFAELYRH